MLSSVATDNNYDKHLTIKLHNVRRSSLLSQGKLPAGKNTLPPLAGPFSPSPRWFQTETVFAYIYVVPLAFRRCLFLPIDRFRTGTFWHGLSNYPRAVCRRKRKAGRFLSRGKLISLHPRRTFKPLRSSEDELRLKGCVTLLYPPPPG